MKGKAAVVPEPGARIEIREYPVRDPKPDEILIRITMASVCGSDLHMWRGEVPWFSKTPTVPGHEHTGVVAKLGSHRTRDSLGQPLREGDRVAYNYFVNCGECWLCLSGSSGCSNRYRFRREITADDDPHFMGGYAEYYYLQRDQWIFKVPDNVPDELVAPVNCALAQVVQGLDRIGVRLGDVVVVQGAGGLGLYACAVARDLGAGRVIAIDAVPERLALAREFGADETIDLKALPAREERVERVRELTRGHGADLCIEVAGVPAVVQEGLELLRPGGRYLMMGNIVPGLKTEIVPHDAVRLPKTLMGVLAYERWAIPLALDWLSRRQDAYPFHKLAASKFPLERINEAFEAAEWAAGQGSVARAIVVPG